MRLSHITICESPQGSDILEFANIVTGPRRRYLADLVIDLELVHECAEEGALYIQSGSLPPRACTVGFSACITQVFETLATWRDDEVRGGLIELMIELKVERKAYGATRELIGYDASLVDLPTVSVVSQLWFHPDTFQIEVSAYYVLALCRRLSQLRAVWTDLGPRCCSEETASTPCMEGKYSLMRISARQPVSVIHRSQISTVLTQQIISAVPRLTDLQISALFWLHCPRHVSGAIPHLPRSSVESLRQLSYRLQELSLTPTDTCLRQFFSPFDRDDFDATSESIQSWPALRHLTLNGTFVYADGIAKTEQDQFNEGHLTCVGRATRFMPKLEYIWIHNQNHGEGEPYGELRFTFHTRPYGPKRDKSQGFCLSVENHMPSSTVVEIWRESLKHAQRETLAVEVHRGRVYDMNEMYDSQGPPPEEEWESWETSMSHPSVEVVPESIGMSSDEENAEA